MQNTSSPQRYVVISSDCHAGADLRDYRPYLESRWHDAFDEWVASYRDPWVKVDDDLAPNPVKMGVESGDSTWNWDSARRLEVLEADGIVAEVLFPNTAPPFFPSGAFSCGMPESREEYDRRFAGLRAHNRWLADFCADAPGRRAGLAQVFLNDVDETVEEIRKAKELGLSGVLLPSDQGLSMVPLFFPRYDAIWAACEELALPVHRHGNVTSLPASPENGTAGPAVGLFEGRFFHHRALAQLIFAGVFDRFPSLKFVMTEVGNGWVPQHLRELDQFHSGAMRKGGILDYFAGDTARSLRMTPSEYWDRNVYLGASLLTAREVSHRHEIGVDRIMWGSDLPHLEGSHPFTREAMSVVFAGIPSEEVAMMLGGTAGAVYGFDMGALQIVADQVGPSPEELNTPLAKLPSFPEETVHPALSPENLPASEANWS